MHVGSRVRVWTEFNSSLENGRIGGERPVIDEDKLDPHQAFVDVTVGVTGPAAAVLRVGGQEIALGSGRMYALREGPTVPLSFDGVRVTAHAGPWQLDGWAARPVDIGPGVFDDASHRNFDVWGVYGSRVIMLARQPVGLDVYYLGLARDAAQFEQGTANETRHTFGARVSHPGHSREPVRDRRLASSRRRRLVAASRSRPRRRERRQKSGGPEPPDIQRAVSERHLLRSRAAARSEQLDPVRAVG
jgi:hypothetical protein